MGMQGLQGPTGPTGARGPTGATGAAGVGFEPFVGEDVCDDTGMKTVSHPAITPGSFIMTSYYDNEPGQAGIAIMVRFQGAGSALLDCEKNRGFRYVIFNLP